MYMPLNYETISVAAGSTNPSSVKVYDNKSFAYWERSLFHRAANVLDFTLPEEWQGNIKNFFLYCLFKYGYVVIAQDARHGLYFQPCTLAGRDFYYQPTRVLISNPDLSTELNLHTQCELLQLTPDYMGIWDVITYYAAKLSNLDGAVDMSIINNKFAYVLGAKNKPAGEMLKKIFDKINSGEPTVIYDQKLADDPNTKEAPFQFLERQNLKQSYLTTDQLQDFRTILNNFDAEIGIPTIPNQKKERMVTTEADAETYDGCARSEIWYKTLKSSIENIKKLYPELTLDVKLRYDIQADYNQEGGETNGEDNTGRL